MFYTSVKRFGSSLLVRYINDGGIRLSKKVSDFEPQVFSVTKRDSGWSDLYGTKLEPKRFDSIAEHNDFTKTYSDVDGMRIYTIPVDLQYIHSEYPKTIDWQYSKIKVFFLDIECSIGKGFPDPNLADQEVTAITVYDSLTKQYLTFGQKECNYKMEGLRYFNCGNERKLLTAFVTFWESNPPDILTGWNIDGFDLPYLVNRIKNVLGEDYIKKFSPWGKVNIKPSRDKTKKVPDIEFLGVEILDYLELYKKYVPSKQESYRLDFIAEKELGENKVDYSEEYSGLQDLYERNFDKYIEYNVHDVTLVVRLEKKMKMIQLQCNLAYKAKTNYRDVFSPVKLWSSLIKNELWYDNKVLYDPGHPGEKEEYDGAFVKDPFPGIYDWVVSIDATSMYPTAIMSYNISPETMLEYDDVPQELLEWFRTSHVDRLAEWDLPKEVTDLLVKHDISMAANGQMYWRETEGILPRMVSKIFEERKFNKKSMLDLKAKVESGELKDSEEVQDEIGGYSIAEKGLKVFLNSLYGALANEFFPLFNVYNAEAITLSGQAAIKAVSLELSNYINKLGGTDRDNVIYIDTDSIYMNMSDVVAKLGPMTDDQVIDALAKFSDTKINAKSKEICTKYGEMLNMRTMKLEFKREKVIPKIVFIIKKRYFCMVGDSEGVRYKVQEFSATGVETNRSSTPKFARGMLEDAFTMILQKDNDTLLDFIDGVHEQFMTLPILDISFPRGVNGLKKYADERNIYNKGNGVSTPIHVRAALLYNHWLKKKGLDRKYPPIYEGEKIRFVYLKPSYIKEDVIAFGEEGLPEEFGLEDYVDREMQFEKAFLGPVKNVCEKIGWKWERSSDLSSFF